MNSNLNKAMVGALVLGLMAGSTALAQTATTTDHDKAAAAKDSCKSKDNCKGMGHEKNKKHKEMKAEKDAKAADKNSCGGKDGCSSKTDGK